MFELIRLIFYVLDNPIILTIAFMIGCGVTSGIILSVLSEKKDKIISLILGVGIGVIGGAIPGAVGYYLILLFNALLSKAMVCCG
jgi:hypothetical protein